MYLAMYDEISKYSAGKIRGHPYIRSPSRYSRPVNNIFVSDYFCHEKRNRGVNQSLEIFGNLYKKSEISYAKCWSDLPLEKPFKESKRFQNFDTTEMKGNWLGVTQHQPLFSCPPKHAKHFRGDPFHTPGNQRRGE